MNYFDVVMSAYDRADMCDLVGFFILDILKNKLPLTSFGLYGDDTQAISRRAIGYSLL